MNGRDVVIETAETELPSPIREKLRQEANFTQSFFRFARDHVAGFQQPVAAAAAIIAPVLIAFTYALGGVFSLVEVSAIFGVTTILFLGGAWFAQRKDIAWAYAMGVDNRRRANDDLRLGRGEQVVLTLRSAPMFVEHDGGVIILADPQDGRTLYFDIDGDGSDPRWFLYVNADFYRRSWRWFRLKGSGSVVDLTVQGEQISTPNASLFTDASDAADAIALALGDPMDGELIDLPFSEATQTVRRLL